MAGRGRSEVAARRRGRQRARACDLWVGVGVGRALSECFEWGGRGGRRCIMKSRRYRRYLGWCHRLLTPRQTTLPRFSQPKSGIDRRFDRRRTRASLTSYAECTGGRCCGVCVMQANRSIDL